jgi:hypothetical protein
MPATIGPDDLDVYSAPRRELLERIVGVAAEEAETHAMLPGVQSTQRLALAEFDGRLEVALWPGELTAQAQYLYGNRKGTAIVAAARSRGWTALAAPQIAFFNSRPTQRLYLNTNIDAADYAARWENGDLAFVGQYPRETVRSELWPWLLERGYAEQTDTAVFDEFVATCLGRRPAHLRPGLRLRGSWTAEDVRALGGETNAVKSIQADVNAILGAADEPPLPATA